jgi:predicted Zn-dependent protease
VELLKKLISRQPNDVRLNELMAGLYFETSKFAESAHSYQIAARNATDLAAQRPLWLSAAQAYEKAGDPKSAIEILTPLALKSKDLDLFMQIGSLYMHQRQFEQAEKAFGAALQLKPDCAPCWSNLGSAFLLQEKHPQALDCFLRFSKLSPQTAGTYFYMATIYDKYGDTKNAISNYQKFLDLDQGKTETQDFQARQRIKTLENRLKRR